MASISPASNNLQNAIVVAQRQVQQDQNSVQQNNQRLSQSQQSLNRDQAQLQQSQQQSRSAQQSQSLQPVQQPDLNNAIKLQSTPQQAVPAGLVGQQAQVNTQGQTIGSVINVTA